jgi:tetratricopeptide (TPR) repeat protein
MLLSLCFVLSCSYCHAMDQAEQALDDARRLAKEGKYAEALEKHIWFHNHALEFRPSYYGVRLSFALRDWVDLGEKYPTAITALTEIRDSKSSRLLKGEMDRELLNDVEAINKRLKDQRATVELFKKIDAMDPVFAMEHYELVEKALVGLGEYTFARKFLVDPENRLKRAKASFDRGMDYAKTKGKEHPAKRAYQNIFSEEIVNILKILEKTGDVNLAKEIQSEALKILDDPRIRDALKPAANELPSESKSSGVDHSSVEHAASQPMACQLKGIDLIRDLLGSVLAGSPKPNAKEFFSDDDVKHLLNAVLVHRGPGGFLRTDVRFQDQIIDPGKRLILRQTTDFSGNFGKPVELQVGEDEFKVLLDPILSYYQIFGRWPGFGGIDLDALKIQVESGRKRKEATK